MSLDAVDEYGDGQHSIRLHRLNQLRNVRLLRDDVLAVQQHAHSGHITALPQGPVLLIPCQVLVRGPKIPIVLWMQASCRDAMVVKARGLPFTNQESWQYYQRSTRVLPKGTAESSKYQPCLLQVEACPEALSCKNYLSDDQNDLLFLNGYGKEIDLWHDAL